jgi:hypothetical protein
VKKEAGEVAKTDILSLSVLRRGFCRKIEVGVDTGDEAGAGVAFLSAFLAGGG